MFAIVTSHRYHHHLPLSKLRSALGEFVVVDTSDANLAVSIGSDRFVLRGADGEVDLLKDQCFYYPESFSLHTLRTTGEELPNEQRAVALDSWLSVWEAMEAVSLRNPFSWVNPPCFARPADNKAMLSFFETARHGFRTPASVVSNDSTRVLEMSAGGGLAVKAVSRKEYLGADKLLATQFFSHNELVQFNSDISTCPLLYQPFILSPRQLRVYVFGSEVMVYKINSDHSRAKPDVRVAGDLEYEIVRSELPSSTIQGICNFVQTTLQLDYVALDFLVEDDSPILIDINPNGVWNWMPAGLANQIDAAFISAIESRVAQAAP